MGLRMGAAWGCAEAQHVAAQERSMGLCLGAAQGHIMELHRGAACSCAWVQHGAAHERSMGLRMTVAWGCGGA